MANVNGATKARTFGAWNPSDHAHAGTVFADGKPLGRMTVPPRSLIGLDGLELTKCPELCASKPLQYIPGRYLT